MRWINANKRNTEPLAAMRENLPVSQVKSADDEGLRAARCFVEILRRLEDDAVALRERFDAKALGEGSPKVFPHCRGDRLTLASRLFGVGEFEIRERALLSTEARSDEAPELSREPRSRLHGHGARNDDRQPEPCKFQAKTQPFWELHETGRRPRKDGDSDPTSSFPYRVSGSVATVGRTVSTMEASSAPRLPELAARPKPSAASNIRTKSARVSMTSTHRACLPAAAVARASLRAICAARESRADEQTLDDDAWELIDREGKPSAFEQELIASRHA